MNLIFITQVYPSDPAAVGQYFEDAAVELARRGHHVTVYTANRDYDDPSIIYDAKSRHPGVKIIRLPFSSFGKKTILHRLLGQGSYLLQSMVRLLFVRKIDGVVLTTIPATTGVFFLITRLFRRIPYLYWVMDINPDQAIALGIFSRNSLPARLLSWVNRKLVDGAKSVICLDIDMEARLGKKKNITIIPPWPLEQDLEIIPKASNSFIRAQNWTGKFVFMYSGNHSMVHPLKTLLDGLQKIETQLPAVFAFIGGGRGKVEVDRRKDSKAHMLPAGVEIASLPYQPIDQIKFSLSAADVQVVSFGDAMVGIVHPCKFYGALKLAKPILFLGPANSALGKIVQSKNIGWCVPHGAVEEMQQTLESIISMPQEALRAMGARAGSVSEEFYNRSVLCPKFCDKLEKAFA